ncbi:MAG TPA: aldehyde ferredoxin oxidoreductase C-terminal domain-containing protein [Desulfosalsimonadaceae bacterium]|nr:aldehyde ferredoxin oxidoreductase C-terminal domain-containing protein [Desulfosalsimonadaceae bacterium]
MKECYGFTGKIARVDLSSGSVEAIEPAEEVYRKYLGGWALGMYFLVKEGLAEPDIDALGPDNMLQLLVGPVTGVAPNPRTAVVTKSPYGFNCITFCGGQGGANLKFAGWDGLQIVGKAEKPVYIAVIDDHIEIRDAGQFWGMGTEEAEMELRKRVLAPLESSGSTLSEADLTRKWAHLRPPQKQGIGGKRLASTWVIGPAGENMVWFANMVTEGARAHGRYGSGAVAGAKNLKGIVVRGTKGQKFADKQKFVRIMHNIQQREGKSHFWRTYGTAGASTHEANIVGGYPIRNWQWESWADPRTVKTLSGPFVDQLSFARKQACPGCTLHCLYPARVSSENALLDETITDMPDWEAMGMVGGNIGYLEAAGMDPGDPYSGTFADMTENAAKSQYTTWFSDNAGMDYIEGGALLGLLMELRQRDMIEPADLDGIDLRWGDVQSVQAVLEKTIAGSGIGKVLARGTYETARYFSGKKDNPEIMYYSMTGKRYAQPAHGTRSNHDRNALDYVTVVRPCEHTGGGSAAFRKDPIDYEGAVQGQNMNAAVNSMIYCLFASGFWGDEGNVELLRAVTGWSDFSKKEFLKVGERAYALSRLFNLRAQDIRDPRKEWDCPEMFPARWFREPLPTGPYKGKTAFDGDISRLFDECLPRYWEQRGWSREKGIPEPEKLKELGLAEIAEDIAAKLRS